MLRRICATPTLVLALALVTLPGFVVVITPAGTAAADVCASVGRRISVSGCRDLTPPPAYYAPLPEDVPPPPPPPPVPCIGYNGRWVSGNTCN
ncbi:MAG: hypothetical protein ABI253_11975 [Mycobacterium sp.]